MPRDLLPEPPHEPILTASPETRSPAQRHLDLEDMAQDLGPANTMFWDESSGREPVLSEKAGSSSELHPFVQVLSISDLESCVALDNLGFPENERCSREKVCLWTVRLVKVN